MNGRGAARRMVRAGNRRHRLAATVVSLVVLAATAMVVLGIGLLTAADAPFERSFAEQRGAHAVIVYDPAVVSDQQLRASAMGPAVVAAAGPFDQTSLALAFAADPTILLPPAVVAGRDSPDGPVDVLHLHSGRWATAPGEIVLSLALVGPEFPVGDQLTTGSTTLTVVGLAASITDTADAWVTSGQLAQLPGEGTPTVQMLYRFREAGDAAAVTDAVAAVTADLPTRAVLGTGSYLTVMLANDRSAAAATPFVTAFAVLGIVVSVLIVANVVGGAVLAGYRHIGILKAIGFTPTQVVTVYAGRMLVPAAVGAALGLAAGNVLALPVLNQTALAYQVATVTVPVWANVAAVLALALVVGTAAVVPAARAGRLPASQALALGRAPHVNRGRWARRLLARTALPRPVSLGLGTPFARPARAAGALVAITLGATTLVLATGLATSLALVADGLTRAAQSPVRVGLAAPDRGPAGGPDPAVVEDVLRAIPGAAHVSGVVDGSAGVAGLTNSVRLTGYQGDGSWAGYRIITGRWYAGADEAVVSTNLLATTGTRLGDSIVLQVGENQRTVRIAGEFFDVGDGGLRVITDATVVTALDPDATVRQFEVGLLPGTDPQQYVSTANSRLMASGAFALYETGVDDTITLFLALIVMLVVLVTAVAALGVFNTTLLNTREQVRDIGILKAVGMTPRQTRVMVVSAVAGAGAVAGAVAIPLGMALHSQVLWAMARVAATNLPVEFTAVYHPGRLALLALAGVVIAVVGALVPAGWAARSRPAAALRAE